MYSVIGSDGKEYGPVDLAVLQDWMKDGRMNAQSIVIDQTSRAQMKAENVPGLFVSAEQGAMPPKVTAPYTRPDGNLGVDQSVVDFLADKARDEAFKWALIDAGLTILIIIIFKRGSILGCFSLYYAIRAMKLKHPKAGVAMACGVLSCLIGIGVML